MKSGKFWLGIIAGVIVSALVGFFLLPNLGLFPVTATGEANLLDWWGHANLESYLEHQVPENSIPAEADPAEGFEHYRAMCLHCHGGPDARRQEWAEHMLPKPPKLWEEEVQKEMSDGALFYIVKHGIRMTGMPAFGPIHRDEDIWNMVAFIRQLDQLTDQQQHELQERASQFGHEENHGHDHDKAHHESDEENHHDRETTGMN